MHSLQAPAPPRAGCAMHTVSGFAPQLHPQGNRFTRFRHLRQCAMHIYCPIAPQMHSGLLLHHRCFASQSRECTAVAFTRRPGQHLGEHAWRSMASITVGTADASPEFIIAPQRPSCQASCAKHSRPGIAPHVQLCAAPSTTDAFVHVQCLALRGFSPVLCLQQKHAPVHIAEPAHSCLSALSAARPPWSAMTYWKRGTARSHVVTWTWKSSLRIWSSCS